MKKPFYLLILLCMLCFSATYAQTAKQPDAPRKYPPSPTATHKFTTAGNKDSRGGVAGCDTLSSTFAMGNGNQGAMVNLVGGVLPVTINFFDVLMIGDTGYVYIYYRPGSYAGHESDAAGWTLLDSVWMSITTQDSLYRIPIYVDKVINPADTAAFYISGSGNINMDYTDGAAENALFTQNAFLKILEGIGKSFPFGQTYTPRILNMLVDHCPAGFLPCESLTTTYAGGNGNAGIMFDITAMEQVEINTFSSYVDGAGTIKLYTKSGTHVGFETDSAAWSFRDSVSVTSAGPGVPTSLPFTRATTVIPAGQTVAFYITSTFDGAALSYTNGSSSTAGSIYAYDGLVAIKEGTGANYPFAGGAAARIWNGTLGYCLYLNPVITNTTDTACMGDTYSFGGQNITSAGTYYDTLTAASGGDSIVALALVFDPLPTPSINYNATGLGTQAGYAHYQWMLDGVVLPGDTFQTYVPTHTGAHTVVVTTAHGCTATSPAVNVSNVSVVDIAVNPIINVYPNPVTNVVNVILRRNNNYSSVIIMDVAGKVIAEDKPLGVVYSYNTSQLTKGVYLLKVTTDGGESIVKRFMKQ
jgi:hypothetical protein